MSQNTFRIKNYKIRPLADFRIFSRALESVRGFFLTIRMAIPVAETKIYEHFIDLQLMGKMVSETNFVHSKVVFSPAYRKKSAFFSKSSIGPILTFFILRVTDM